MSGARSAAIAVTLFSLAACAAETTPPPPPTVDAGIELTEKGGTRHEAISVTATVESVDQKKRLVTLKAADGTKETVRVGPEVKNLSQLRRGDSVVATYYQSVAFDVVKKKDKDLEFEGAAGLATAEPGQTPAALGAHALTLVADIVKLDRTGRTAVLQGPEGRTLTVAVQTPEVFDRVKVGDRVEIRYTEALAIDVEPAAAR